MFLANRPFEETYIDGWMDGWMDGPLSANVCWTPRPR